MSLLFSGPPRQRRRAILVLGLILSLVAVSGGYLLWERENEPGEAPAWLLTQARRALARQDYEAADGLASQIPREDSLWPQAQLVAGEAAMRTGRTKEAIERFQAIVQDGSSFALDAQFSLGEMYRKMGQVAKAEKDYAAVLAQQPDNSALHERVAFLLGATGRRWESGPHLMKLVRLEKWTLETLVLLGDLERPTEQMAFLDQCRKTGRDDILAQLGLATLDLTQGRTLEAHRELARIVACSPNLIAAQSLLGELLVSGDDQAFNAWHAQLPPEAEAFPDIWHVRGLWASRFGNPPVAARCFWEALKREPTHRRATFHLGQVLTLLGDTSAAKFVERAARLSEITTVLDEILRTDGQREAPLRRMVELMRSCGRLWEAWAWAKTAKRSFPYAEWPRGSIAKLETRLLEDPPQVVDSQNLAKLYDLSALPAFESLAEKSPNATAVDPIPSALAARIRFEEATKSGIEFIYNNGADPATKGARMFEQTGGGVGVLDFDGDRLPDLYFTQGSEWKTGETSPTESEGITDRLYRNRGGRDFADVTFLANLGDRRFSQGCAAGDVDNDGFVDLSVGNIGRNRLYRNNGDGTFDDVTADAGLTGADWTSSCTTVDLNADGFPDLFEVGYVSGPDVYSRLCQGHGCSPSNFTGVIPRLHISRGDGSFASVPVPAPQENAKGLGVLAVNLTSRDRPSLLITNDQVPNFLLKSLPDEGSLNLELEEEAFLSGLAINADGVPLAGMGIAADDLDGNGLVDFFITNFQDESNSLYRQDSPGLFIEVARQSNLSATSWSFVGWGTQPLDADLDGNPDLVLANGHVDDFSDQGGGYKMRPQFFRNRGNCRFEELKEDRIGPYFGRELLGRGLSRLDWNADGRMDFVVSNIGDRASLVTNQSEGIGRFLNIRLHGTIGARDAIGTVVEVVAEGRTWTKQLMAGDGYMASNERFLQFGLGSASAVSEIRVHWPSGTDTTVKNPPLDATIELVESPELSLVQALPER